MYIAFGVLAVVAIFTWRIGEIQQHKFDAKKKAERKYYNKEETDKLFAEYGWK